MSASDRPTVVIGIGNPDRGDDAAGPLAARRLREILPRSTEVHEHIGEAMSLLACIQNANAAYLIDACASGAPAGTVRRFDATAGPLPHEAFGLSSHGLGLAEAIELARALGQLPHRCIVFAIEAGSFATGGTLSPAVVTAVEKVADRVREELCSRRVTRGRIGA